MAWKSKDRDKDGAEEVDLSARLETSPENKTKAGKWFKRASELADKRQYDTAIEYYVNGLEFWPEAVDDALKALHGCAVARKQTGGKKPGFTDTLKKSMSDKNAAQAFLNSLWLFGHDPDSHSYMEGMVKNAARMRAADAAMWAAGVYYKAMAGSSKINAKQFQSFALQLEELGDLAVERGEVAMALEAYDLGISALSLWQNRFPKDHKVEKMVKDLSTKKTIQKGNYQSGESFRDSIRDVEEQKDLHDIDRSVQASDRVDELIAKAEQEYRDNPDEDRTLTALVDILSRREKEEDEKRAISFLVEAYKRTKKYRWKQRAEDIRIRQLNREGRLLEKAEEHEELKAHKQRQMKFELGVYRDRHEQYPTDLRVQFEYAKRLFGSGRYDDAIPILQSARSDPKNRIQCGLYLGRCFLDKGLHEQAISTLSQACESEEDMADETRKEVHYWLGRCLEDSGDTVGAKKTYGKLLEMDYNYMDVRARLEGLPSAE